MTSFYATVTGIKCIVKIQVFAIEFVAFAIEFVPFAIDFVPFTIEFVGFSIEFVGFAVELVGFAIKFVGSVCITIRHKQKAGSIATCIPVALRATKGYCHQ